MCMKKKVIRKLLAGILAVGVVIGVAACGDTTDPNGGNSQGSDMQNKESGEEASDSQQQEEELPPLKLSVLMNAENQGGSDEYERMVQTINEYTNTEVKWVFDSTSEYTDAMVLRFSAQNLESVNQVNSLDANFCKACEEGVFWDITDYIDDYPNLATIPEIVRMNASVNGRLYGVPRARDLTRNGLSWRQDWLDNLGLEEPTTLEAFYKMLYEFTYSDPDKNGQDDTYGMALISYEGPWDLMQIWFGAPNGWGIDENGDLIPAHMTKEYDTALDWFRQIYSEGLVNPNFTEITESRDWDNMMKEGVAGSIADTMARGRYMQTYFDANETGGQANIFYSVDMGYGYLCQPTEGYGGVLAISKKMVPTENELRRVLQFINDLNDAEMSDLIEYGFEGIHYFITEEGYFQYYTDEEKTALGVTTANYRNGFNQALAFFRTEEETAKRVKAVPETGIRALETEYMKESEQYAVQNYALPYLKNSPTYVGNGKALDDIMKKARLDYIMGTIDRTGLDARKNAWLNAGGQDVIDEVNALYHGNN
ncbi:extracellular solute-binding protein [bacterium D16-50]|nr:extracellular solute-binding protein [bacterium D16-50]